MEEYQFASRIKRVDIRKNNNKLNRLKVSKKIAYTGGAISLLSATSVSPIINGLSSVNADTKSIAQETTQTKQITYKYVDENGTTISDPVVTNDFVVGSSWQATSGFKTISGYGGINDTTVTIEDPLSPISTSQLDIKSPTAATVTYHYKKIPTTQTKQITYKYVDENGTTISDPVVTNDFVVGSSFRAVTGFKTISGYGGINDTTVTFEDPLSPLSTTQIDVQSPTAATVTYHYKKISLIGADVTVRYVDVTGKAISDDMVIKGKIGEGYSTKQKKFSDYTFKEIQGKATGNFTDRAQIVTYIYTKNNVTPLPTTNKPFSNPLGKSTGHNSNNKPISILRENHSSNIQPNTLKSKTLLPQTGTNERNSVTGLISGLLILASASILLTLRRKKGINDNE